MFEGFAADAKLCARLVEFDEGIAASVRERGCSRCGGRLDRADFPRKPRGGAIAAAAEAFSRRISLCCSREGCRARCTPPSVRFLGRRVYVGITVIIGAMLAAMLVGAAAIQRAIGVPARSARRWTSWFRTELVASPMFAIVAGRFMPPLDRDRLPGSLLERFAGDDTERLIFGLGWLSAWSTTSCAES